MPKPCENWGVKILAVCGMGIGTSVLLKMNAEKALMLLDLAATVDAVDLASALERSDAQVILTTADLVPKLTGSNAEVISIEHVFDLEELSEKLSAAFG